MNKTATHANYFSQNATDTCLLLCDSLMSLCKVVLLTCNFFFKKYGNWHIMNHTETDSLHVDNVILHFVEIRCMSKNGHAF